MHTELQTQQQQFENQLQSQQEREENLCTELENALA